MLKCFFEIGTDAALFDGLNISKDVKLCEQHLGKYPVLSISLKDVQEPTIKMRMIFWALRSARRRSGWIICWKVSG